MGGLDAKVFGVKDVISILIVAGGFFAQWYTMNDRVGDLEDANTIQATEISALKEANKALAGLPKDVQKMQLDIEKNGKTLQIIYFGLVAKDIIPPPK